MNVLQKKKKLFKKIILSFLSLVIVGNAYYTNVQIVKADTSNVITYNSYGSTTRGTRDFEAFGNTYALIGFIDFNFNGQYNGIINIYLTGASPMSNFSVLCENCHIINQGTNYLQIEFYGQNNVSVNFVMKNATAGSFDIQSVTYQSMTKVSDSNSAELVNIKNRLSDIKTYTDGIESLLATNNSLLNDIKSNTANGGSSSSTVNNIDVNVDLIADDLNLLKTNSDGILSALVDFLTDSVGGILTVENVIDAIESTTTALLGVQTQLTTINGQLTNITNLLTSIDNNIQNIDNSLDTITFTNHTVYHWQHCNAIGDTLSDITDDANYGTSEYYYLPNSVFNVQYVELIHIRIPFWIGENNTNVELELYSTGGFKINDVQYYLSFKNYRYIDIYLNGSGIGAANYYIKLIANQNIRGVTYREFNNFYEKINSNDIEYWNLLSFINQYQYNKKLLDAIKSISIEVTQQDITNTTNNVNNYNSTMNNIENIELNFKTKLENDLSNLTLNSNYINPVNTNVRTAFDVVIQDFILDHNNIAGAFYLILICSLLLLLLGRW